MNKEYLPSETVEREEDYLDTYLKKKADEQAELNRESPPNVPDGIFAMDGGKKKRKTRRKRKKRKTKKRRKNKRKTKKRRKTKRRKTKRRKK